ncbi:MAG: YdcF family protein [Terriglobia bacterium]
MDYIQPLLSIIIVAFIVGTYLAWRRSRRAGPILLTVAAVGLFLLSWLPFARMVAHRLEDRFPPRALPAGDAQAIVVISGAMTAADPPLGQREVESNTYERCVYAAWLYKNWLQVPVLASGGPPSGRPQEASDAGVMATVLEHEGVPASSVWLEPRSHSTHQNALDSSVILHAKNVRKIVLVTSAVHMLRAERCFAKEGLTVIPAACDYRTYSPYEAKDYFPCWTAVRMNEDVLHEVAGLAWYWLHGWV